MRVFYDTLRPSIVVETTKQVYPPLSLEARVDGDNVSIWPPDGLQPILSAPFTMIQNENGDTFSTGAETLTYLNGQFALKPYTDTNNFDPGDLAGYWNSL